MTKTRYAKEVFVHVVFGLCKIFLLAGGWCYHLASQRIAESVFHSMPFESANFLGYLTCPDTLYPKISQSTPTIGCLLLFFFSSQKPIWCRCNFNMGQINANYNYWKHISSVTHWIYRSLIQVSSTSGANMIAAHAKWCKPYGFGKGQWCKHTSSCSMINTQLTFQGETFKNAWHAQLFSKIKRIPSIIWTYHIWIIS